MNFLQWIKTSFEDDMGHVSHRKMTVFFFSKLTLLMVVLTFIKDNPNLFPELVWISIITGALGMSYLRKKTVEDEIKSNNKVSNNPDGDPGRDPIVLNSPGATK